MIEQHPHRPRRTTPSVRSLASRLGPAALAIGFACACGESSDDKSAEGDTTPPPSAAADGASKAAPAAAAPDSKSAAASGEAQAAKDTKDANKPAAVSGAAGAPAMVGPASRAADAPASGEKRFPDACDERRASWSKPCSTEKDPCGLNSGFPGDEYCLLPPPEGKGIQIHFGPKSYTDMEEVKKYLIKPGEEFNQYAVVNIPTTEQKWFGYMKLSMRPGSHHLINNLVAGHPDEGFVKGLAGCDAESLGSFPGTQNLIMESPPQGIPAPENEGLGRSLPGNASICQNYHRYNDTDAPTLSEIWYNLWFIDEQDITQKTSGVTVTAGPWSPIPAHSKQTLTTTTTMSGDARVLSLFGHRHAATERFQTWVNDTLVYDSWDWVEARVFNYDSITQNPPLNPDARSDGATSGVLNVKTGDKIRIQCDVNNTTDQPLRFANELYTGEMCILFGSTVGAAIR